MIKCCQLKIEQLIKQIKGLSLYKEQQYPHYILNYGTLKFLPTEHLYRGCRDPSLGILYTVVPRLPWLTLFAIYELKYIENSVSLFL